MINYPKIFNIVDNKNEKYIIKSSLNLAKKVNVMFIIVDSKDDKYLYNECLKIQKKSYLFSNINDFYNYIKEKKFKNLNIGFTTSKTHLINKMYEFSNLLKFIIYYKKQSLILNDKIKKYNETLINENDNTFIKDAINKLININCDGKFIRGCLIDLGYKLSGKKDNKSINLSLAYETFQTSILIHDDIIDNAHLRRGKDTIQSTYKKEFNKFKNKDNTPENLALCIGDLGFYFTNKLIINSYKNNKNFSKLLNYYNDIVINTIKGEILDVYLPYVEKNNIKNNLKENDILEIYKLKTAYYSIIGPFCLGMILGNIKDKIKFSKIEKILMNIGISFQIKDDILGIFSNIKTIGKSSSSDIKEFKQTILYSYIKINKPKYYTELIKYYGKKELSDNDIKNLQNIIIESGSLEYANNKIDELTNVAINDLKKLNINSNIKNILFGFITYLNIREK